jgi:hypothetical protein
MSTASKVAASKLAHPEMYCPVPRCLWRTGGGRCPRHLAVTITEELAAPLVPLVDVREDLEGRR